MKFTEWCKIIGAHITIDGQMWDDSLNFINVHLKRNYKTAETEDYWSFGRSEGNGATIIDAINSLIARFRGKIITFKNGYSDDAPQEFYFPIDIEDVKV